MKKQTLDIDTFIISDYTTKPAQLEKYTKLYSLVLMGESNGLWYCKSQSSNYAYSYNEIPKGRYATALIANPMTFSVARVWNYLCDFISKNNEKIKGVYLGNESIALFVRFYKESNEEYMKIYIPLDYTKESTV